MTQSRITQKHQSRFRLLKTRRKKRVCSYHTIMLQYETAHAKNHPAACSVEVKKGVLSPYC